MRLEGATTTEISKQLRVEKRTVYIWFSDPLVKAALAHQLDRVNEIFAQRAAAASLRAIDELLEIAVQPAQDDLTSEQKVKALFEILDRAQPTAHHLAETHRENASVNLG